MPADVVDMTRSAAVFPGQGAQEAGMGVRWRESPAWPVVGEITEGAGVDVARLLLHADGETLRHTDNAQLSMFAMGVLAYRDAQLKGLTDRIVAFAGHSLGEYVALVAADALSVADGARLVAARGAAMLDAANRHRATMVVVVGTDVSVVDSLVADARSAGNQVWVANVNAPGQVVLSGTLGAIEAVSTEIQVAGMRVIKIPVGGAFHCPLMESSRSAVLEALESVRFADRHRPIVSNVDAAVYERSDIWPELLVEQLTAPVLWSQSLTTLVAELHCDSIIEYGQAKTLTALAKRSGHDLTAEKYDSPLVPEPA